MKRRSISSFPIIFLLNLFTVVPAFCIPLDCKPEIIGKKIREALASELGIESVSNLYVSLASGGSQSRSPFFFKSKSDAYIGTIPFNFETCAASPGVSAIHVQTTEKATVHKRRRRRK